MKSDVRESKKNYVVKITGKNLHKSQIHNK